MGWLEEAWLLIYYCGLIGAFDEGYGAVEKASRVSKELTT